MKTSANLSYLLYMASVTMAGPITKRATSTYDGGLTANDVTDGGEYILSLAMPLRRPLS